MAMGTLPFHGECEDEVGRRCEDWIDEVVALTGDKETIETDLLQLDKGVGVT